MVLYYRGKFITVYPLFARDYELSLPIAGKGFAV